MQNPLSPIGLHLPDEDRLTKADMAAVMDLRPADGMLCIRYPWDTDKGAAEQIMHLVRELGHKRLVVRYHDYGIPYKDPGSWARECFNHGKIYDPLRREQVTVECILGNEMNLGDARSNPTRAGERITGRGQRIGRSVNFMTRDGRRVEGGHKDWGRHADGLGAFAHEWRKFSGDPLHLPAPSRVLYGDGQSEADDYWRAIADRDVQALYDVIDVHHYGPDWENAVRECRDIFGPDYVYEGTEANDTDPENLAELVRRGWLRTVRWFILDWRNYGGQNGAIIPEPRPDDRGFSLLKFPESYQAFKKVHESVQEDDQAVPQHPLGPTPAPLPQSAAIGLLRDAARAYGVGLLPLLGLAIAESGLETNSERWAAQRPDGGEWINRTASAVTDIKLGDREGLEQTHADLMRYARHNFSFGLFQREVKWADEQVGVPHAERETLDRVLELRALYLDPARAIADAAPKLRALIAKWGDPVVALWAWNKPNDPINELDPASKQHYRKAYGEAGRMLGAPEPDPEPPGEEPTVEGIDPGREALWRLLKPDVSLNPEGAFFKAWDPEVMGSPITEEYSHAGQARQGFLAGTWRWAGGDKIEKVEAP